MSDTPQVSKEEQNWAMTCHLAALPGFLIPFGNPLMFIVGIGALIFTIMAAVKVSNGDFEYRYPLTIRLLK